MERLFEFPKDISNNRPTSPPQDLTNIGDIAKIKNAGVNVDVMIKMMNAIKENVQKEEKAKELARTKLKVIRTAESTSKVNSSNDDSDDNDNGNDIYKKSYIDGFMDGYGAGVEDFNEHRDMCKSTDRIKELYNNPATADEVSDVYFGYKDGFDSGYEQGYNVAKEQLSSQNNKN